MTSAHHDHHDHGGGHTHEHPHSHSPASESDPDTVYNWRIHHPYGPDDSVAIEVAPRRGLLPRWRFVVPGSFQGIVEWGTGAPGGGPVDREVRNKAAGGPVRLTQGPEVIWFGGLEPLSSRTSAYLVFAGEPPHYVAFGQAEEPDGPPGALEGISFGDHPEHPGHSHAH